LESISNSDEWVNNACGHRFHADCIKTWLRAQGALVKSCPMCRTSLSSEMQFPKIFRTGYIEWRIKSNQDMNDHIVFVQKQGRRVSAELVSQQLDVTNQLIAKLRAVTVTAAAAGASSVVDLECNIEFKFFITETRPVVLSIGRNLVTRFDLWSEFEMLHNKLIDVMTGPMMD
jgi:hypothetical protein